MSNISVISTQMETEKFVSFHRFLILMVDSRSGPKERWSYTSKIGRIWNKQKNKYLLKNILYVQEILCTRGAERKNDLRTYLDCHVGVKPEWPSSFFNKSIRGSVKMIPPMVSLIFQNFILGQNL